MQQQPGPNMKVISIAGGVMLILIGLYALGVSLQENGTTSGSIFGPSDEGAKVAKLLIMTEAKNLDGDRYNEVLVAVAGGAPTDDYGRYRFGATLLVTVEMRSLAWEPYKTAGNWTYTVKPGQFVGDAPAALIQVDDTQLPCENYCYYRLTVNATMDATGKTFETAEEAFYQKQG